MLIVDALSDACHPHLMRAACAFMAAFVGCADDSGSRDPDPPPPEAIGIVQGCVPMEPLPIVEALDVPYVTREGQVFGLDLAVPDSTDGDPLPMVIAIHGGGWREGDKAGYRTLIRQLAGQGWAAASLNYRLADAPTNIFPAAVNDVICASRRLAGESGRLGIDVSRVVVYGGSAGGHLAAMLALAPDFSETEPCDGGSARPRIVGAIALAGPMDLRDTAKFGNDPVLDPPETVRNFLGADPLAMPDVAASASPITYVSHDDPPLVMFHGQDDAVVPIQQSREMRAALGLLNVPATLIELPGGHGPPPTGSAIDVMMQCTVDAFITQVAGR